MRRRSLAPVLVFAAWTLFVWSTRFGTIWSDDTLDTPGKVGRTLLAGSFVVLALATLALVWRARSSRALARVVLGFAGWTVAVWLVRGTAILLDDHAGAFKAVHSVLGVMSIGLAVLAVRAVRSGEGDVEGEGQAAAAAAGLEELVDG